jgi:hypothetical protein
MIYFVRETEDGFIKIGTTVRLTERLKQLEAEFDVKLEVLAVIAGGRKEEKMLHRRFAHNHPWREWFSPSEDLLRYIKEEGEPWDGDKLPFPASAVKVDRAIVGMAKALAIFRGVSVAEVISEAARRDVEQAYIQMLRGEGEKPPKGKGGPK